MSQKRHVNFILSAELSSFLVTYIFRRPNKYAELHRAMIHYLKNKVGVVDFANAQEVVMF